MPQKTKSVAVNVRCPVSLIWKSTEVFVPNSAVLMLPSMMVLFDAS